MKSSSSRHQPLFLLALILFSALPAMVFAQDEIVLENGQRRQGEVLGVSDGNVTIKVGPAQSAIPLSQVRSATMAAPAGLTQAQTALQDGSAAKALVLVRPVVEKYRGLPADWMPQAFALLGETLVQLNQLSEAEKIFAEMKELYPDSAGLSSVAAARLDVANGDFASAREKLTPIVTEAEAIQSAEPAKSATYGRAFLLMGQVRESEGQYPEALQDYLRTVTVFYADPAVVAEAGSRAEKLAKAKNVIAP